MVKKFITYCFLFFIPVVITYGVTEFLVVKMPSQFKINKNIIEKNNSNIEIIISGSSQLMSGVNPGWLSDSSINIASGNQHHDTDFKLLKTLLPKLTSIKTVVIEASYSHFELPKNGKNFWKNSLYFKYYDVNCFERFAYFKDKLLFLSNPSFFTEKLEEHYIKNNINSNYNHFGFNYADSYGQFSKLDYDEGKIDAMKRFKINTQPNLALFEENTSAFFELLDFLEKENKNVIIVCLPMYKTYVRKRNPEILKRRDSVLKTAMNRYKNIIIVNKETDTLTFQLKNYWNQSHLSPSGAKKFTQLLDSIIYNSN